MMDAETMRRALELQQRAKNLKFKFDKYLLMKAADHYGATKEVILVGYATGRDSKRYETEHIDIPETARRHVFNLWRRETALKYNAIVRELNQIGMKHDFALIDLKGL